MLQIFLLRSIKRLFLYASKILKWTGIVLLSLIVLLAIAVALLQNRKFEAPYPDITASTDSAVIARGREIVFGSGNCNVCHGGKNADSILALGQEPPLTGGEPHPVPFGTLFAKNLTPDPVTGIGRRSDRELARTLRYNVNADGTFTLMPGHNFTDEDLTAIISYLRSRKPVRNEVPDNKLNLLGRVIKAFLLSPDDPNKKEIARGIKPDTTVAYGEYLAVGVSDCKGCHTEGDLGTLTGVPFAGGSPMGNPGTPMLTPPNLTQHSTGRIYGWSQQDFINRFRKGKIIPHSVMPWESFKRMSDTDLKALYNFLKSLEPAPTPAPPEQ